MNNERIHRLLDANINRAVEGIRVLEEAARMVLDDAELTSSIKDIRHTLVQVVKTEKKLSRYLLLSRGSEHDVLRSGETLHEQRRNDCMAVVEANAGRAQEALRVLEEYGKLLYPSLSGRFKELRFFLYDIEKKLALRLRAKLLLSRERLGVSVILDYIPGSDSDQSILARACIDAGVGTIVFNDFVSPDNLFLIHAGKVVSAAGESDVTTLVCDRLDCAIITGADGILLGPSGLPVEACKRLAVPGFIIGSTQPCDLNTEMTIRDDVDFVVIELQSAGKLLADGLTDSFSQRIKTSPIPVVARIDFSVTEPEALLVFGFTGVMVKADSCSIPPLVSLVNSVRAHSCQDR